MALSRTVCFDRCGSGGGGGCLFGICMCGYICWRTLMETF